MQSVQKPLELDVLMKELVKPQCHSVLWLHRQLVDFKGIGVNGLMKRLQRGKIPFPPQSCKNASP